MSPERIRPGSASRRAAGSGGTGGTGAGESTGAADLDEAALAEHPGDEQEVGSGEGPGGADSGEAAGDETPVALPTPSGIFRGMPILGNLTDEGPQPSDEPLRPEEFVDEAAAEEALGFERAHAVWPPVGDESDEADPIDLEIASEDLRAASGRPSTREGFWHRLYYGRTRVEFVRRRRIWFSISAALILAGAISLATRGLNLGIDFAGGTSWSVKTSTLSITAARNAVAPLGFGDATITQLGNPPNQTLQVQAKLTSSHGASAANPSQAEVRKVADALAAAAHVSQQAVGIQSVGPSWGGAVTNKAIEALIVFFVLVSLYISIFFEWRMALAAVVAVAHDVLVVVGIYSLTGFEVTPDTVVAILTILGYSLYDTIVVFDRVRDNVKGIAGGGRVTISDIVNLSMNQTLARSINTSLVAILPILAVLLLGADLLGATTLQYFGWALLIGLVSGAYSSIFIASPIVAMLKEREPRYRVIREKLAARGLDHQLFSAAAIAEGALGAEFGSPASRRARRAGTGAGPEAVRVPTSGRPGAEDTTAPIRPGSGRARPAGTEPSRAGASSAPSSGASSGAARRPPARSRRKGRSR